MKARIYLVIIHPLSFGMQMWHLSSFAPYLLLYFCDNYLQGANFCKSIFCNLEGDNIFYFS